VSVMCVLDLGILKMYLRTKNELSGLRLSKVGALRTYRRTDRCNRRHTAQHLLVVIKEFCEGRYVVCETWWL